MAMGCGRSSIGGCEIRTRDSVSISGRFIGGPLLADEVDEVDEADGVDWADRIVTSTTCPSGATRKRSSAR